jgi:uncharacterized protein YggU (UPF0235/DUF167 family)
MFIKIRVKTGARRESVALMGENKFNISVKEKAERGQANERILQLVAQKLKVPKKNIRFISGHKSPSKLLEIL